MRAYVFLLLSVGAVLRAEGAPGLRGGLDATAISRALDFQLGKIADRGSSPQELARSFGEVLAAPGVSDEERFAIQLLDSALSRPQAAHMIQEHIRGVELPEESGGSARIADNLKTLVRPYHEDKEKRQAFSSAMESLRRRFSGMEDLHSEVRLKEALERLWDQQVAKPESAVAAPESGRISYGSVDTSRASPDKIRMVLSNPRFQTALEEADIRGNRPYEFVVLQDQFSQSPNLYAIGGNYVFKSHYTNDERGDVVRIFLYPGGDPSRKAAVPAAAIVEAQDRMREGLEKRSSVAMLSDEQLLRKYVVDTVTPHGTTLSEDVINYLVRTLASDKKILTEARSHSRDKFLMDVPMIELRNIGSERYFRFVPVGAKELVNARVLDLHRRFLPYGIYILVEWIETQNVREASVRRVGFLKESELKSIHVGAKDRADAAEAFEDSLTPNQVATKKLARKMGVQLFGYTHNDRIPDEQMKNAPDPLTMMLNISHLAIRKEVESNFGSISDLMTEDERRHASASSLDVMARLDPRYVFLRFEKRNGFKYMFVVTEDGQLKVSPLGDLANLKPWHSLRLAHGRRVYAAGFFTIDSDGGLKLILRAHTYQPPRRAGESAFRTKGNENLNVFLMAVFRLQAGRNVRSVESADEVWSGWFADDDPGGFAERHGRFRQERRTRHGFESEEAFEFVSDLLKGMASPPVATNSSWNLDDEKAYPLHFQDWIKAEGRELSASEREARLAWAHYVLHTSADMSLGQIKSQYRRLARRFHPDRNSAVWSNEAAKAVNDAMNAIEEYLR